VSSARRLVNISGAARAIDREMFTGEIYGSSCLNGRVYNSATTTMVAEIGTKLMSQEPSK
jgi:hypothetical protein